MIVVVTYTFIVNLERKTPWSQITNNKNNNNHYKTVLKNINKNPALLGASLLE